MNYNAVSVLKPFNYIKVPVSGTLGLIVTLAISSTSCGPSSAADIDSTPLNGGASPHAVTRNQKADLHQTLRNEVDTKGSTPKEQRRAKEIADIVNTVPGEKVTAKDLEHAPITGFHPIKKIVAPIHNLELSTEKLNHEAGKLEKPIGDLQAPMIQLQKNMVGVDTKVGHMQHRLKDVSNQVTGARSDLSDMREEIGHLKEPIQALQKPVSGVADPLTQIQIKLNVLLGFIVIFGLIVAFGTPLAAILLYRNRAFFLGGNKPASPKPTH